ncbi:MAG: hypothetical protein JXA03_03400 [Bacteroidales bacterium]|nr:hypothetical protein [Bacteroidales bacterium]
MKILILCVIPVCLPGQEGIKIIAHRGASFNYPENTMLAFSKALEAGAGYIELDIRLSADDSIMVIHDETIDRTTNGSGEVRSLTFQHLRTFSAGHPEKFGESYAGERIPSFYEVISVFGGSCVLCVDMKNVPEQMAVNLANNAGAAGDVVWCSYNRDKLERIRGQYPGARLSLITNLATESDICFASDLEMESLTTSWYTPGLYIRKAHTRNLEYWAGVIDDPAIADIFIRQGADAIITGNPAAMALPDVKLIHAFPNPFTCSVSIVTATEEPPGEISILDETGKIICRILPDSGTFTWTPGDLPGGIYFITAVYKNNILFEKILFLP